MGIGSVLSAISFAKDVIAPKSKSKSGFIEYWIMKMSI